MTFTLNGLRFKSKYITDELAHLFSQSDSEEEFEGFSDDEEDKRERRRLDRTSKLDSEDSDEDMSFYSDTEEASPPRRKSLLVALRFPIKRASTPKQQSQTRDLKKPVQENDFPPRSRGRKSERQKKPEVIQDEKEEDVLSQSLSKRRKNIQENKAMLAKLFADLSTMADLALPSPVKKKKTPQKSTAQRRRFEAKVGEERRNPSRKARPPENFAVEDKEPVQKTRRTVDIHRLVEVDEEHVGAKRKRRSRSSRRSACVEKPVDEVTEEDLDNIAYSNSDKVWDKEHGSSCHQCRQKTRDTKSVCRSGFCSGGHGQFCGPCLKNRYGEDVRAALLNPTWSCPRCRGVCNCSLCRKKEGRCATGILVGLARYNGHDNVHDYLRSIQRELQ